MFLMPLLIWGALTVLNTLSLLSYRSLVKPFLFGYSFKYLVFLLVYFAAAALFSLAFSRKVSEDASRTARLTGLGLLAALLAGLFLGFTGLVFETIILPWAFPLQLAFAFFYVIYRESRILLFKVVLVSVSSFLALKAADLVLSLNTSILPFAGTAIEDGLLTLDLYPFEGWHLKPNYLHRGDLQTERQPYKDYVVQSSTMGYFMDFDINNPPKKQPHEYRIILIGGSGAMGIGGQTNEFMLYRQLERQLNERLKGSATHVRVINMAMAGSSSYQNFISLNRYGHALEPDLILSYSGYNDYQQLVNSRSDTMNQFPELNAYVVASRGSEFPPGIRFLKGLFPNLMTKTNAGISLKLLLSYRYFVQRAKKTYEANRGIEFSTMSNPDFLKNVILAQHVLALQSIKRDFQGIPIMLAWQAMHKTWTDGQTKNFAMPEDFYNWTFSEIEKACRHHVNDRWYFVNVHHFYEDKPVHDINMHLSNKGHEIVAGLLAEKLVGVVKKK